MATAPSSRAGSVAPSVTHSVAPSVTHSAAQSVAQSVAASIAPSEEVILPADSRAHYSTHQHQVNALQAKLADAQAKVTAREGLIYELEDELEQSEKTNKELVASNKELKKELAKKTEVAKANK